LIKNSLWLAIQFAISIITGFVVIKLSLNALGAELYGVLIVFLSFWGMTGMIDFGLGTALIKFIAEKHSIGDIGAIRVILSSTSLFYIAASLLLLIFGYVLSYLAYMSTFSSVILFVDFVEISIVLSLAFLFQYLSTFFRSALEGISAFKISSKINLAYNLSQVFLFTVFLSGKSSLFIVAVMYLISSIIWFGSYFSYFIFNKREILPTFSAFSFKTLMEMFSLSFSVQGSYLIGAAIDPTIKFLLSNNGFTTSIPYFEVARRAVTAISGLYSTALKVLLPKTSALVDSSKVEHFWSNSVKVLWKFGIVYGVFLLIVGMLPISKFLVQIYGNSDIIFYLLVLSLPEIINIIGYPTYMFLLGRAESKTLIYVQLVNFVLIVTGLYFSLYISNSQNGLYFYFLAVFITNFYMLFVVKSKYFQKIFDFSIIKDVFKYSVLLIALCVFYISFSESIIEKSYLLVIPSILFLFMTFGDLKIVVKEVSNRF